MLASESVFLLTNSMEPTLWNLACRERSASAVTLMTRICKLGLHGVQDFFHPPFRARKCGACVWGRRHSAASSDSNNARRGRADRRGRRDGNSDSRTGRSNSRGHFSRFRQGTGRTRGIGYGRRVGPCGRRRGSRGRRCGAIERSAFVLGAARIRRVFAGR
jgi:hypothetical protein